MWWKSNVSCKRSMPDQELFSKHQYICEQILAANVTCETCSFWPFISYCSCFNFCWSNSTTSCAMLLHSTWSVHQNWQHVHVEVLQELMKYIPFVPPQARTTHTVSNCICVPHMLQHYLMFPGLVHFPNDKHEHTLHCSQTKCNSKHAAAYFFSQVHNYSLCVFGGALLYMTRSTTSKARIGSLDTIHNIN